MCGNGIISTTAFGSPLDGQLRVLIEDVVTGYARRYIGNI